MKELKMKISFDLCLDVKKAEQELGTNIKRHIGDVEEFGDVFKKDFEKIFNVDGYQRVENIKVIEV